MARIVLPEVFSFIDAPDEALQTISALAQLLRSPKVRTVWIDQKNCKKVELCAESVASVVALEGRRWFKTKINGSLPADPEQAEITTAAGMPKILGFVNWDYSDYEVFRLQKGRKTSAGAYRSTAKEIMTGDVVEYINRCLSHYGWELSAGAADVLGEIIGEVITNAEDHSSSAEWWIAGYFRNSQKGALGDCHITIFNFGNTIYQSLNQLPSGSRLRSDIESRVEAHTRSRFFRRSVWTAEDLWTVYALQEAVSRHNLQPDRLGHRGMGTVKMIEFFQAVAPSEPRMCVLSGSTHILFDGTYRMRVEPEESGGRRVIAFNSENDLNRAPDHRYVRHLKGRFPGTLLSLRFNFDQDHLDQIGARQ